MDELEKRLEEVIARRIRPVLWADHGDIALDAVTSDGRVVVRLTGACATCPGAENTLANFVSSEIMAACKEVKEVARGRQVDDETIEQALRILRKPR